MSRRLEAEAEALDMLLKELEECGDYPTFAAVAMLLRVAMLARATARVLLLSLPHLHGGKPGKQTAEYIESMSQRKRLESFVGIRLAMQGAVQRYLESIARDWGRKDRE